MTSIRFVTGKSSGILSDISSSILSGISAGILSGISSGILPGISSAICSGISSGTLSGISSGISSDILSGFLSGKPSGICSGKHSGTLSGIPSGILSGRWGPRLRSSGAHWAPEVPGWGPAVPTALRPLRLRSSRAHSDRKLAVEVQQCPLRAEVGEEIGDELARRRWTWKLMQTWPRRNWRRRKRRRRRRRRRRRKRRRRRRRKNSSDKIQQPSPGTWGIIEYYILLHVCIYILMECIIAYIKNTCIH